MTAARAGIPLALAVPAYLTGMAVGSLIATAWNAGDDARGLVRLTARTLHRPSREVRARMALGGAGHLGVAEPVGDPGDGEALRAQQLHGVVRA